MNKPITQNVFIAFTFCFFHALSGYSVACGWGGEDEDEELEEVIVIGADGKVVESEIVTPLDDPTFQTEMGDRYRLGEHFEGNFVEAAKWYKKASAQGHAIAQNNLAMMYEGGIGVSKDVIKAFELYRLAADKGNAKAQHSLASMYLEGRGVERNLTLAAQWMLKSADNGHLTAIVDMARLYEIGEGVKDELQSYVWWKAAAMQGKEEGERKADALMRKFNAEQQLLAETYFVESILSPKKQTQLGLYLTAGAANENLAKSQSAIQLLDVRTPEEYMYVGHAPMAINIPVKLLKRQWHANLEESPLQLNGKFVSEVKKQLNENDIIYVICRSGVRSTLAVNLLAQAGFTNAYNIVDGFEGSKLKNTKSNRLGKRVVNGWKNATDNWGYELKPELMYRP